MEKLLAQPDLPPTSVNERIVRIANILCRPEFSHWEEAIKWEYDEKTDMTAPQTLGYIAHWFDRDSDPTLGCAAWVQTKLRDPRQYYAGVREGGLIIFSEAPQIVRFRNTGSQHLPKYIENTECNQDFASEFGGYLSDNDGLPYSWSPSLFPTKNTKLAKDMEQTVEFEIDISLWTPKLK